MQDEDRSVDTAPCATLEGVRLLVIEDEPLIALTIADSLEIAGAEVARPIGTEREALSAIEGGAFDAALLDANLHGRPVTAVAAALMRHGIPFAFVTGYDREALPESFRHLAVLRKPFNDRQLLETVTSLVARTDGVAALPS
jgi:CheY-like chemotaxis protein